MSAQSSTVLQRSERLSLFSELRSLPPETLCRVAAGLLNSSLEAYVAEAWGLIEPTPFTRERTVTWICEHIEAVTLGQIKRLTIATPPRFGKSTLVSVLWPTWEWARDNATSRWIFASNSEALAIRDRVRRRAILESSWYRLFYPNVRLASDVNSKSEYNSTIAARCSACWPGGSLGRGASRVVIDDPHPPSEALLKYVRGITRRDAIVVCHSRLHPDDLIGTLEAGLGDDTPRPAVEETANEPSPTSVVSSPRVDHVGTQPWPYMRPWWNP